MIYNNHQFGVILALLLVTTSLSSFTPVQAICRHDIYESSMGTGDDTSADLPPFSTIVVGIEDDCTGGSALEVPDRVTFILHPNDQVGTHVTASAPQMVLPFVRDGALRFRWNPNRPTTNDNDEDDGSLIPNTSGGVWILFDPVSVTTLATMEASTRTTTTAVDHIYVDAPWGALRHIVSHTGADWEVSHGDSRRTGEHPDYYPQDLTYTDTAGGPLDLDTFMGLTLNITGTGARVKLRARHGVDGTIAGTDNEIITKRLRNLPPAPVVVNEGTNVTSANELLASNNNNNNNIPAKLNAPAKGCENVVVMDGDGNVCDDTIPFDLQIGLGSCNSQAAVVTLACGLGGGGGNSGAPLLTLQLSTTVVAVVASTTCLLLGSMI